MIFKYGKRFQFAQLFNYLIEIQPVQCEVWKKPFNIHYVQIYLTSASETLQCKIFPFPKITFCEDMV